MRSKEIVELIDDEKGRENIYKKYVKYFNLVDIWEERLITGDLLNEYELRDVMNKTTGIFSRFSVIVNAIEAYSITIETNVKIKDRANYTNFRAQDCAMMKIVGEASINHLRLILGDFRAYLTACEKIICTAQSQLKRLTLQKGAKGVDFTGDASNVLEDEQEGDE